MKSSCWVVIALLLSSAMTACVSRSDADSTAANTADGEGSLELDGVHPDDWPQRHAECMNEQGFAAEPGRDGGVFYEAVPKAQADDFNAAEALCLEQVPIASRYTGEFDELQLQFLYDWFVTESVPCLEAEGLGGFDPPSREVFVANYRADPWTPYFEVGARLGPAAITSEIEGRCPQLPDFDDLADARGDPPG